MLIRICPFFYACAPLQTPSPICVLALMHLCTSTPYNRERFLWCFNWCSGPKEMETAMATIISDINWSVTLHPWRHHTSSSEDNWDGFPLQLQVVVISHKMNFVKMSVDKASPTWVSYKGNALPPLTNRPTRYWRSYRRFLVTSQHGGECLFINR